jgi:malate dehydrogenase
MSFAAIVGAGELGGAIAARLAAEELWSEIRLIDTASTVAAGKALDIQQSGAVEGFHTRIVSDDSLHAAAGAHILIFADAAASHKEWQGEEGLALLRQVWKLAARDEACVVCAGSTQRPLIERAIKEIRIDPHRICGSAPAALEGSVRALVALEVDGSADDVRVDVVGVPPVRAVIAWSAATLRGANLSDRVPPHRLSAITSRLAALWPPGPYALASAAASAARAIAGGSRRSQTCFAAVDAMPGHPRHVAAVPVRLGARGVESVLTPSLSAQERTAFLSALETTEAV